VVKHPEVKRGFVLLPRRWVVERSFAWAAPCRLGNGLALALFRFYLTQLFQYLLGSVPLALHLRPPDQYGPSDSHNAWCGF
jgi:hypothetical protein